MKKISAIKFIEWCHGAKYDENEIEIAHLATVIEFGEKINSIKREDVTLKNAMSAYMNTPEGKMLLAAVRNAVI